MGRGEAGGEGKFDEVGEAAGAEFAHDSAPVIFNGADGTTEEEGDLFAAVSGGDQGQDFFFAGGQEAGGGAGTGLIQGGKHQRKEGLFIEGFFDEVEGAGLDSADGEGDVAIAGEEEDGEQGANTFGLGKEFHAVHAGHIDIGDEQITGFGAEGGEAVGGKSKASDVDRQFGEGLADGFSDIRLIIDKKYSFFGLGTQDDSKPQRAIGAMESWGRFWRRGRLTRKAAPLPGWLST